MGQEAGQQGDWETGQEMGQQGDQEVGQEVGLIGAPETTCRPREVGQ